MAARRLIIVMLVLLGISTAIAIVVPDPIQQTVVTGQTGDSGATTGDTGETGSTGRSGTGVSVASGPTGDSSGSTPSVVETADESGTVALTIVTGDEIATACTQPDSRLILSVRTGGPLDVAVPEFGRTATATLYSPAVFDLLMPDQQAGFRVTELESGRTLARIDSNAACDRRGTGKRRNRKPEDSGQGAADQAGGTPPGGDSQGAGQPESRGSGTDSVAGQPD